MLEAGRDAGLLAFEDSETAFRSFFGLVGRDVQIRLLLGDTLTLSRDEIERDAARAPPTSSSPSTADGSRHGGPKKPVPEQPTKEGHSHARLLRS